jgi:uracil-DNA glycosylase
VGVSWHAEEYARLVYFAAGVSCFAAGVSSPFGDAGRRCGGNVPLMPVPLEDVMDGGWASSMAPVAEDIGRMGEFLRAEIRSGRSYLPAGKHVLRAFERPLAGVKVLVVGQDPYPTPGHAVGLSFAVDREVRPLPRSLGNIYRELLADVGNEPPEHGDLTGWSDQGVLLLNRVLTVAPGRPGSHRNKGWEAVTEAAIRALVARYQGGRAPLVAVLWGRDAQNLRPMLDGVPVIASAHPSPMSADRGFFGSRPFSRINELLARQGAAPVNWAP